ncbi:F0F1 ATP synthase subunit alpha [Allofustis seminis]|uniref:F0F1 ATP synthase subunit alpha n=1 Tax=Allofustis seminis TaxID=166939 RepID=UPI00035C5B6B|nr:F0F1 ATP synthase subunit alpha [Allofustis seminis]
MDTRSEEIIQSLKERVQQIDWDYSALETGRVISVGDGIVFVDGLKNVLANELVRFNDDTLGMAMNLEDDQVGVILLGSDDNIKENDIVYRTEEIVRVGVGDELLGRVVDPLGRAVDNKGEIIPSEYYDIERNAPSIMSRKSVDSPVFTGVKMIDAIIPIGKGQRELIIGDQQTGKTSIALNTILNQKGQNVKCVYVAIGQKASTVSRMVQSLKDHGAMDYTVVVNSSANDSAALQYIAPYAGCSIAEYWMERGEDALIIYDDLSKHAVAYRTISLLLRRPSGREAYPGDVFYLHSRLLERAAQMNEEHGGGSLTALPVIETQQGDISSYIPTNVISITDGQIFLDTSAFHSGHRPAIDSGLSVSRVGSDAQTKAMKQVSKSLKIELTNYAELESFAQFDTDVDPETQEIIDHGKRLTELLKQGAISTKKHELLVLSIYLNRYGWIDKLAIDEVRPFEEYMHRAFENEYSHLLDELAKDYDLTEELVNKIQQAMQQIYDDFKGMRIDGE